MVGIYPSQDAVITGSDKLLTTYDVSALAAGASSSKDTVVTIPLGYSGMNYIGAAVDISEWVAESDETNNISAGSAIQVIPPDLTVSALSHPASAAVGQTVTVSHTVTPAASLLHVLRDSQVGRLPDFSLGEFVSYALFYPSYPSGPIDRSQRFIQQDLRNPDRPGAGHFITGSQRVLIGLFKKFVLADSLALIALSPQNASQTSSSLWMWVLLYAYSLRLYFDFSGYTDIAIGMGKFLNIHLPENFASPYTKVNLTAFWNSWHITLAQWFRAYVFNPLTRALRSKPEKFPAWLIVLAGQLSTMLLIGLWHGIAWNLYLASPLVRRLWSAGASDTPVANVVNARWPGVAPGGSLRTS